MFVRGHAIDTIRKTLHMHVDTIQKHLRKYGFNIPSGGYMTKLVLHLENGYSFPVFPLLEEVINGGLLGDANMRAQYSLKKIKSAKYAPYKIPSLSEYYNAIKFFQINRQSNETLINNNSSLIIRQYNKATKIIEEHPTGIFRLQNTVIEKKWVNQISKIFQNTGIGTTNSFRKHDKPNYRDIHGFTTNRSVELAQYYMKWYAGKNHLKIIPRDLVLTPNTMLVWLMGDGSNVGGNIGLYTNAFPEDDVRFLTDLIRRSLKVDAITFQIKKRPMDSGFVLKEDVDNGEPDYYYAIRIRQNSWKKFKAYIEKSDQTLLKIAKQTLPWKFDPKLRKKDVYPKISKDWTKVA